MSLKVFLLLALLSVVFGNNADTSQGATSVQVMKTGAEEQTAEGAITGEVGEAEIEENVEDVGEIGQELAEENTEETAEGAENFGCRCRFYRHCGFRGTSVCYNGSRGWVGRYHNDQFSSVKVAVGWACRAYEHAHFRGRAITFYGSDRCFTNNKMTRYRSWNDRISSIRVLRYRPCRCRLYQHCNYRGYSRCYQGNTPRFHSHNDQYSSIRVAKGFACRIYEHTHYRGKRFTFHKNDRCFTNETWTVWFFWKRSLNDRGSSIRVYKWISRTVDDVDLKTQSVAAPAQDNVFGYAAGGICVLTIAGLATFVYNKKKKQTMEYESLLDVDV